MGWLTSIFTAIDSREGCLFLALGHGLHGQRMSGRNQIITIWMQVQTTGKKKNCERRGFFWDWILSDEGGEVAVFMPASDDGPYAFNAY